MSIYSSTFIFAKKQFDDAFHRLDQSIAEAAKAAQANWLAGYQVIISEVLRSYGDGQLTMNPGLAAATTIESPLGELLKQ